MALELHLQSAMKALFLTVLLLSSSSFAQTEYDKFIRDYPIHCFQTTTWGLDWHSFIDDGENCNETRDQYRQEYPLARKRPFYLSQHYHSEKGVLSAWKELNGNLNKLSEQIDDLSESTQDPIDLFETDESDQ